MPTTTHGPGAYSDAARCIAALVGLWSVIAEHSGLVGAWRLMGVCRAAREGAKVWLRTLPKLVLCGGNIGRMTAYSRQVWRLDLAELRWEHVVDLLHERSAHACCAVRDRVLVLAGEIPHGDTAAMEALSYDSEEGGRMRATDLPPLAYGPRSNHQILAVDESESSEGQVLVIGGYNVYDPVEAVLKVDIATGTCAPQPATLYERVCFTATRLRDGRVICAGGQHRQKGDRNRYAPSETAEVFGPPRGHSSDEASDDLWEWRKLPRMSVPRYLAAGCLLSDGRFAVFGGIGDDGDGTATCEVFTFEGDSGRWSSLPAMLEARCRFSCLVVGGCVIATGGGDEVEVFEEGLEIWRRLPCDFPRPSGGALVGSASTLMG